MNLGKIVELDRINMSPILKELGIEFDPERRKNDLVREIEKGLGLSWSGERYSGCLSGVYASF
ncbi:hypothetical protein [Thermosediminibacter oceani]|uniref:Uncharacterized protein n=1 Tax=Thermosediminibacter oceani (strain ATCC BAA-1034 / DSM 16646 / JW/IW-1228P) TaxID=555079 RepID=D9S224_THEOJ|nr:hypothetical protein [Thermosediminibacter oceani]ADL07451.1 hypothetical protein Toce_0680 [Thermosediminibacter oceani DSM 16646]